MIDWRLFFRVVAFLLGVCQLVGCSKVAADAVGPRKEVVFSMKDPVGFLGLQVKAVELVDADFSSFFVTATTGSPGAENFVWGSVPFSDADGDGVFTGGKLWPSENPSYHFYASSSPVGFSSAGPFVSVDSNSDVVCAYLAEPGFLEENELRFEHILARLADLTVTAADGYAVSGVSVTVVPMTAGIYHIGAGAGTLDGSAGWSYLAVGPPVELALPSPGTKSNDLYLVPGRYELLFSWTAEKGGFSEVFTDRSVAVVLRAGKVSSFHAVLSGAGDGIDLEMSVKTMGHKVVRYDLSGSGDFWR